MTTPEINLGDKVNVQNVILLKRFSPLLHTDKYNKQLLVSTDVDWLV